MTVSDSYIEQEVAKERKPVELYHIWTEYEDWYYTNSDTSILYNANVYQPAVLVRGSLERDSQLSATKMTVSFAYIQEPAVQYIADNSVDLTWISVMRVFQDQNPIEAAVIFIGHIRDISFKDQQGQVTCVGFEFYLNKPLPRYRYQPQCNWKLYSSQCGINRVANGLYTTVTLLNSDGLTFTCDGISISNPLVGVENYYRGGDVERIYTGGVEKRTLVWSSGDSLGLRFRMRNLKVGDQVYLYPGCDGAINTCITKYNNVINFGGFPYIPLDNPVGWVWS
jgi:uncharacterized phage protein (TIGR02218 family)